MTTEKNDIFVKSASYQQVAAEACASTLLQQEEHDDDDDDDDLGSFGFRVRRLGDTHNGFVSYVCRSDFAHSDAGGAVTSPNQLAGLVL